MQSKFLKRTLSVVLAVAMVVALAAGSVLTNSRANAAGKKSNVSFTKVANNGSGLFFANKEAAEKFGKAYVNNGNVRASIVLNDVSVLGKGYSTRNIAANTAAVNYSKQLRAKQDAIAAKISKDVLGGEALDVVWNITMSANIISAYVPFDKIEAIKGIIGVKDVVIEAIYEPAEVIKGDEAYMATASAMTGTPTLWAEGYTGLGSKVAIVDTGLDVEHLSFDAEAFDYAIAESGIDVDLLTAEDISAVIDQLHIAQSKIPNVTAEDLYLTTKIPFAANYVDNDFDVGHMSDAQGEHGSHVTGIAAANRYVPDGEGGFVSALEEVEVQGQAPDAQVFVMKVFGKNGGAYDSDYVVAIEDAITLGADSVNLSLGSAVAGLATSDTYQDIFDSFADSDTVVVISSGNNSFWAEKTAYGHLYSEDFNYATDGSPGSYANALTVASVDNGSYTYATVGDNYPIILNEASGYGNEPYSTLADIELQYVILVAQRDNTGTVVAGVGSDEEFASIADIVEGKIAVCSRGSTSFYQKVDAAAANGAVGALIYNNTYGIINMNLTGLTSTIPAASITQDEGFALMELAEEFGQTDDGLVYGIGTIVVHQSGDGEAKMSSFSSWGVPGDLSLKPEISAPGGSIYSVNGANRQYGVTAHDQYEMMSGTSMAAPQITGLAAVMGQFIRDNGLVEKTGMSPRQLINSLLMSTAIPEKDLFGSYYPVLQQGAGLANIEAATSAKSFITVDGVVETAPLSAATSIADGKVKVELGALTDDVVKIPFSIHNFSDEDVAYYLSADFFTQYLDAELRYEDTVPVDVTLLWTINGEEFDAADPAYYDFNGDGVVNALDAQRILDSLVDDELDLNGLDIYADFDEDEDIDSYDARLAFEALSGLALEVEAGETVKVVLTVSGLEDEFGVYAEYGLGGNYIEGYIKVREGETDDGALGVLHSIPVLGFWGDWSEGSMFDKGSYIEYNLVEEPDIPEYMVPYMYYQDEEDSLYRQVFLVSYPGEADLYYLGGNPLDEEAYMPDRNAINSSTVVKSFYHTLIRNAGATRFFVANKYGKTVLSGELGPDYAAYYYPNDDVWKSTVYNTSLNYVARNFKEGDSFTINFQAIPEYYLDANGKAQWDLVNAEKTTVSLPLVLDNTAPFIVGSVYDEETGELVVSAHDNQYIAAVALYTEDGEFLDYYGSIEDIRKGEQYDYSFDLTELFEGEVEPHLLVEVYDYATNLSTYKINLNPEELEDPELSVVVSPEDAVIINNGTAQLYADVYPWGYEDETVYWESADEDIAVVDENGLVTSVYHGDDTITVDITARSAVDESKTDTVTVTILVANKELNGFLWDENGQVWVSEFDISTIPEYKKLNDADLKAQYSSMAYGPDGKLYAATLDSSELTSVLYSVDPATWTFTELGDVNGFGIMDMCPAPSLGRNYMLTVYGPYVMVVNATTGSLVTGWDLTYYSNGSYFVGIAYEGTETRNRVNYDWAFVLDQSGNVYEISFYNNRNRLSPDEIYSFGQIGDSVDTFYWQSLYYDAEGDDLYWSRFNEADNNVELIMVYDVYDEDAGYIASLGHFADGVWPVSGLCELEEIAGADVGNVVHDKIYASKGEAINIENVPEVQTFESINRAPASRPADEIHKTVTEVTVEIRAEELTKNGQITVTIPETATLVSCESKAQYQALKVIAPEDQNDDAPASGSPVNEVNYSTLRFAFVDLEGIEKDAALLTLKFAMGSTGTVIIETEDINDDDAQYVYETVILGVNDAYHEIHTYEAEWTWSSDDNGVPTATADLVCTLLDGAVVYGLEAEITKEVKDDSVVYTATVVYEDKEYTDTKTVGIARINGRSANFGDNTAVNFMLKISEDITSDEDAYAIVTFNGEEFEYLLSECISGARYKITKKFAAKEFMDTMNLKIFSGDGTIVTLYDKDGNDVTENGYDFSMKDYIDLAISLSTDEKMIELAKAFSDYGVAAKINFNYFDENTTLPSFFNDLDSITVEDLDAYAPVYNDKSLETVVSDTATVTYSSSLVLNKYFTFASGTDVSAYTFYVDGVETEATKVNATKYLLKVTGRDIKDYEKPFVFKVTDGTNSYEVEYSILSYSFKALESGKASASMANLAKATYLVYLAAENYFA